VVDMVVVDMGQAVVADTGIINRNRCRSRGRVYTPAAIDELCD